MRKWLKYLIVGGVGVALGLWLGWSRTPRPIVTEKIVRDTITMREVIADTVVVSRVVYRDLPSVEYLRDTLYVRDTVRVAVPLSLYTFEEPDWRAEVEGYAVTLRQVDVYPRTIYQTATIKEPTRWGVGIQLGATIGERGLSPYLGLGIHYTLWGW